MKNKIQHLVAVAALTVAAGLYTPAVSAQDGGGRGNFDPAAMRERMMERYKEQIGVKDEATWKSKVEPLVGKVVDAQREARLGMGGFGGMPRGNRGGGAGGDQGGQGGNRNRFGGEPNPDVTALQKAVEEKAPEDEIKAKLTKVREARKAKESALEKAQDELRKALNTRQEASAVLAGLLK